MAEVKHAEIETIIDQFKKLPDWERFPVPEVLFKKYGLPVPHPTDDLMAALSNCENPPPATYLPPEKREVAPGGVREVALLDKVEVEVKTLEDTPATEADAPAAGESSGVVAAGETTS